MELSELFGERGDISSYPPQRRILIATLECIHELGLEGATVRAIAARAVVNPAAVNYYYRSKDRLIEEALRGAWSHVADDIALILEETVDADAAARLVVRYLMEGTIRGPRVVHAIVVQHPALHAEVGAFFRALFGRLEKGGRRKKASLTALLLLAVSVLVSVAPEAAAALCGADFANEQTRERLWNDLSDLLLSSPGVPARRVRGRVSRAHQKASPRLK
jgi:AcrR family transcriptional regulator